MSGGITMIGWLITEKFAETKDGLPMEFATFEDETALYDATLFRTSIAAAAIS